MGAGSNKLLLELGGQSIIRRTVQVFAGLEGIDQIIVVASEQDLSKITIELNCLRPGVIRYVIGGRERQDSVFNALESLSANPPETVLVHDGARPLLSASLVERVLEGLKDSPAIVPALPVNDTLFRKTKEGTRLVLRDDLYRVQTPQGFRWEGLWKAHQAARKAGRRATDDAQLMELAGIEPLLIPGEEENIKLTCYGDLRLAQAMWTILEKGNAEA